MKGATKPRQALIFSWSSFPWKKNIKCEKEHEADI